MNNKIGPSGFVYLGKICQEFAEKCEPSDDVMPVFKNIISKAESFKNRMKL